jgi:choline transport protein
MEEYWKAILHTDMNWVMLEYGIVLLFSVVSYVARGRFAYVGPVKYLRKL